MSERRREYKEYLQSDYWNLIRNQVLERDNRRCRLCNSEDHPQVHHRTYENIGNEKLEDLITLCEDCHKYFHDKDSSFHKLMQEQASKVVVENARLDSIKDLIKYKSQELGLIKDALRKHGYMKTSEFLKIVKRVNKHPFNYDNVLFINCCLDYFNAINIYPNYGKEMKEEYDLPKRATEIILDKKIYDKEKDNFTPYHFAKL